MVTGASGGKWNGCPLCILNISTLRLRRQRLREVWAKCPQAFIDPPPRPTWRARLTKRHPAAFAFHRRKSPCLPQEGGLSAETERPTCAGAAQQTPSPGPSARNTDPTYDQPSTLVGADESLAAELRRLVHRGHTAKSHGRLRRPTFRGEELVSIGVAGVAQLVEQAPCKR